MSMFDLIHMMRDFRKPAKVWAPGEREAAMAAEYKTSWQTWHARIPWAPRLLIHGSSYEPLNLFPAVKPSRNHVERAVHLGEAKVSQSGRWVYLLRVLPAFETLWTARGAARGLIAFDAPVTIPSLYERRLYPHERFENGVMTITHEWIFKNRDWSNAGFADPWMSITPMEIFTLRPGADFARGRTVVAGLGLGWQLVEVAKNPKVTSIVLLERDEDLVKFILPQVADQLGGKQVEVVIGDAYETIRTVQADTALIDIFPGYGRIGPEMQTFREHAPQIRRWWGWGRGGGHL